MPDSISNTPFNIQENHVLTYTSRYNLLFDASGCSPVGQNAQPAVFPAERCGFHSGMRRQAHAIDSSYTVGSLDGGTLWN